MLSHMRRRRPRPRIFWAWTLTLTAALLAVVWVGSMRVSVWVLCSLPQPQTVSGGGVGISLQSISMPYGSTWGYSVTPWQTDWWFRCRLWTFENTPVTSLFIPLWPFVLLTGVPGVWMLIKSRKHTNPNACPACGYDRTGLPQSSTSPAPCPECGKSA